MMTTFPRIARALTFGAALALPLAALAPLASAPAHAADAASDLSAVSRTIRGITTLTADFTQTDRNGQVATGRLLLKQPGHIRFDYGKNSDLLVVADGKSLYIIDYQVSQVQRLPIRNSPVGALLDPTRDLTRYGKLVPSGDPRIVSVDVRDTAHPEYGVLNLVFIRKEGTVAGLELYGWVAKDAQGNQTTLRLTNTSYGTPIADSAFRWRDPRPNRVGPR